MVGGVGVPLVDAFTWPGERSGVSWAGTPEHPSRGPGAHLRDSPEPVVLPGVPLAW